MTWKFIFWIQTFWSKIFFYMASCWRKRYAIKKILNRYFCSHVKEPGVSLVWRVEEIINQGKTFVFSKQTFSSTHLYHRTSVDFLISILTFHSQVQLKMDMILKVKCWLGFMRKSLKKHFKDDLFQHRRKHLPFLWIFPHGWEIAQFCPLSWNICTWWLATCSFCHNVYPRPHCLNT